MPAAIMGNHPVPLSRKTSSGRPSRPRKRPAMVEYEWLTGAPVLEINLRAIFRSNRIHHFSFSFRFVGFPLALAIEEDGILGRWLEYSSCLLPRTLIIRAPMRFWESHLGSCFSPLFLGKTTDPLLVALARAHFLKLCAVTLAFCAASFRAHATNTPPLILRQHPQT